MMRGWFQAAYLVMIAVPDRDTFARDAKDI